MDGSTYKPDGDEQQENDIDRCLYFIDEETPAVEQTLARRAEELESLRRAEERADEESVRLEVHVDRCGTKCAALHKLNAQAAARQLQLADRLEEYYTPNLLADVTKAETAGVTAYQNKMHRMTGVLSERLEQMEAVGDQSSIEALTEKMEENIRLLDEECAALSGALRSAEAETHRLEAECCRLRRSDAFGPAVKTLLPRLAKRDLKQTKEQYMKGNMYLKAIPTMVVDDGSTVLDGSCVN